MKILLDTQSFIWWSDDTDLLSNTARAICADNQNQLWLSYVSMWEMQIKVGLDKMKLSAPLDLLVERQVRLNGLFLLPIEPTHLYSMNQIPLYPEHKDPFDRLLIAQVSFENLTLLTSDAKIRQYEYGISVIW